MKYIVLIILLIKSNCCFSQNLISGTVKDSSGNYVEAAIIRVLNNETKLGYFFSLTNSKGFFEIIIPDSLLKNKATVIAQAFGFITQEKEFNNIKKSVDFILLPDIAILEPIIVKDNSIKIRKNGDTLNYTAASFSTKSDKTIGDVLKKIPGIDVDNSGRISFNGTPINYFYIDGDNLLDDRYNIATQSISYDVVDKIQVIEKNQHIKMFSGIVESDKPGINITFKEKNKLNWINDASFGTGFDNLSLAEINAMIFKSRFKSLNVFKYNNIGNNIASGLSDATISESNSSGQIEIPETPIVITDVRSFDVNESRYLFNNTVFLSLNNLIKTKTGLSYRFNLQALSNTQKQSYSNQTNFNIPNADNVGLSETNNTINHLEQMTVNFAINVNSTKRYINLITEGSLSPRISDLDVVLNNNNIYQRIAEKKAKLSVIFNGISIVGTKRFVELFSETHYQKNPQSLFFVPGLFDSLLNSGNPYKAGNQQLILESFVTKNYFSIKYASNYWLNTFKPGFSIEKHRMSSDITIEKNMGNSANLGSVFSNTLQFTKQIYFLEDELRWQKTNTQLILNMPVGINNVTVIDNTKFYSDKSTLVLLQPSFQWSQKFSPKLELLTKYFMNNQFGNIANLYRGSIITDYRQVLANQLNFLESQNELHQFTTTFTFKQPIKIMFFNLSARYSFQQNKSIQTSEINSSLNKIIAIPFLNSNKSFSVNSSISKYLFFANSTLNISYKYRNSVTPIFQNNEIFNSQNKTNTIEFGLRSKIKKALSSNIEYVFFSMKNTNANTQKQSTQQFKQNYALEYTHKTFFVIKFVAESIAYWRNEDKLDNFTFFDASAKFFIKKPNMELETIFSNLGNVSSFSQTIVYSNSISTEQTLIRGRTAFLKISFKF